MPDHPESKKRVREASSDNSAEESPPHKTLRKHSNEPEDAVLKSGRSSPGQELLDDSLGEPVTFDPNQEVELIEYESDDDSVLASTKKATPKDSKEQSRAGPETAEKPATPTDTFEHAAPENKHADKTEDDESPKAQDGKTDASPVKANPFLKAAASNDWEDEDEKPKPLKSSMWKQDPTATADVLNSKYVFGSSATNPFANAAAISPLAKSMQTQLSVDKPSPFAFAPGKSEEVKSSFGGGGFGSFSGGFGAAAAAGSSFGDLLKSRKETKEPKSDDEESEAEAEDEQHPEDEETEKIHLEPMEVITGEENEVTLFQARGKLYHMDDKTKDWKERGVGLFRVNKQKTEDHARLIMRADGVLRLILNVNIFEKMPCEVVQGKFLRFAASETPGKLTSFLVKTSNPEVANKAFDTIAKFSK